MTTLNGSHRPTVPSPSGSFVQLQPKHQYVLTCVSSVPFTVTPASAVSESSSRNSPFLPPLQMDTNSSVQTTPEGLQPVSCPPSSIPIPITFPESMVMPPVSPAASSAPTSSPFAMAEAVSMSKTPNLMRRISRGAQSKLTRRRGSASHKNRDHSCGPVVMRRRRRRSDSRGVGDAGMDISDFELEHHDEEVVEDPSDMVAQDHINALGILAPGRSTASSQPEAPLKQDILQRGTMLTKVTKKGTKQVLFRLDFESAKVCWGDSSRPSKQLYIDDISEIRTAADAKNYRELFKIGYEYESRWFTIIYTDSERSTKRPVTKAMHLIAQNNFHFQQWTQALQTVSRSRIEMMASLVGTSEKSIKALWQRQMEKKFRGAPHSDADERLDLRSVCKICRNLHINCSEKTFAAHFLMADDDQNGTLSFLQFLNFIRSLKERKDINHIYSERKSPENAEMSRDDFFRFLAQVQGVDVESNKSHWINCFEKFARLYKTKTNVAETQDARTSQALSLNAFQAFLSSSYNSVLASPHSDPSLEQPHYLDKPLNEYFISSSHNTYLLGRQVVGESSTEAYISALQKGCRCIEIDCWDGSDGRPIVMHGRTFTTSVLFADCISVIDKFAFASSPYPLIISLEVHCNPEQQNLMAEIMKMQFGDKLLLHPLDDSGLLPSPERLRGCILIKVKPAEETEDRFLLNEPPIGRRQRSFSSPFSRPVELESPTIPNSPLLGSPPSMSPPERTMTYWSTPRTSVTSGTVTSINSSAEDSDSPPATLGENKRKKAKTSKITKNLGDLGVYTRGTKFSDFVCPEAKTYNHVISLAERGFDSLYDKDIGTKLQIEEHNMRHLMRIYPSGHRIKSSNFDPIKFWRRGVQMAATNWQTPDLGTEINNAMFASGIDRTGYVLKPDHLRVTNVPCGFFDLRSRSEKKKVVFSLDVISAQQLPRPRGLSPEANINPYVEVEVYTAEDKGRNVAIGEGGMDASAHNGMSGIGAPLRKRTKIVKDNGFDPQFNASLTMTVETRYPSLIFVRWTVYNSSDGNNHNGTVPLAGFTAKLGSLQQGYRHLNLVDHNGEQYLFSKLFCKIKKQALITVEEARDLSVETFDPTSPHQERSTRRDYFKRLLQRTPSERRRREVELSHDGTSSRISRSSTLEK